MSKTSILILKEKMKSKGYGVISFSKAIGISHQALYDKLNGKTAFNVNDVLAIRNVLELTNEEVMGIFFHELSENNG